MKIKNIRIPTNSEYLNLVRLTGGRDNQMHWSNAATLINDNTDTLFSMVARGGCYGVLFPYFDFGLGTISTTPLGFRPVFEVEDYEPLLAEKLTTAPINAAIAEMRVNGNLVDLYLFQDTPMPYDYLATVSITEHSGNRSNPTGAAIRAYHLGNGVFIADQCILSVADLDELYDLLAKLNAPVPQPASDRTYIITEVCPHCEAEVEIHGWNTDTDGFQAFCPYCGKRLMLCDECQHQKNALPCDYCTETDTCRMQRKAKTPSDTAEE